MLKRSWRLHGSTHAADGQPYAMNLKVMVFGETPEEAIAQFRAQWPKAWLWSITHAGKVIVPNDEQREDSRE